MWKQFSKVCIFEDFLYILNLLKPFDAVESDLVMLPMDLAILQRRAVELVEYNISLLIEHLKGYLMVEGVAGQGAEVEGGVDVEEEGVTTDSFCLWCTEIKFRNGDG